MCIGAKFLNEICPTTLYSKLGSLANMGNVFGIFLSYLIGYLTVPYKGEPDNSSWRILFAAPFLLMVPALILLFTKFDLESPVYSSMKKL